MYAIISDRSQQTTVRVGDEVVCDLMDSVEPGQEIQFESVLLIGGEGAARIGKPTVAGARVTGEVLGDAKGKKLVVFRFHRRKNVRTKNGHRQRYTRVRIKDIQA